MIEPGDQRRKNRLRVRLGRAASGNTLRDRVIPQHIRSAPMHNEGSIRDSLDALRWN
jgi:hypothetical protein